MSPTSYQTAPPRVAAFTVPLAVVRLAGGRALGGRGEGGTKVGSNCEEHQRELFGLDDNETVVDSWNGFAYLGPLDGSASGAGEKAGRIGRRLGRLKPLVRVQASHAA